MHYPEPSGPSIDRYSMRATPDFDFALGETADMIRESFRHSLVCGLYKGNRQVGLTRIITDYATFAYLCDVYIDPAERGNKVGTWMVDQTLDLPQMPKLRRWVLFTQDAQDLYRKFGFENPAYPERVMERHDT